MTPRLRRLLVAALLPATLSAQTAPLAATAAEAAVILSPFEVKTASDIGYIATNSISGTRTNVELKNVPMSIQVLTSELLRDTFALNLDEAMKQTAGLGLQNTVLFAQRYTVRGFNAEKNLRNGFARGDSFTDTANLDRVEIIKGPASTLYGEAAPGGMINMITKKPLFAPRATVEVTGGTGSAYRSVVDLTGPLGRTKNLAYRLVGSAYGEETDVDFERIKRTVLAPSATWRLGDRVTLNVDWERITQDTNPQPFLLEVTVPDPTLPSQTIVLWDKNQGGLGYKFNPVSNALIATEQQITSGSAEIKIIDSLVNRAAVQFFRRDHTVATRQGPIARITGATQLGDSERLFRTGFDDVSFKDDLLFDYALAGKKALGKFLAGYEYTLSQKKDIQFVNTNITPGFPNQVINGRQPAPAAAYSLRLVGPANELNPAVPATISTNAFNQSVTHSWFAVNSLGLLDEKLHVTVGGRRDTVRSSSTNYLTRVSFRDLESSADSWQLAAIYEVVPGVSVFASRSTSFIPNGSRLDINSKPLDPQTGTGTDVGVKLSLFGGKLTGNAAYFDITRKDVARNIQIPDDITTPLVNEFKDYWVLSGRERSKGFDFDLVLTPAPRWQVLLNGTFLDAKVERDAGDPRNVGTRVTFTPENTFTLWTKYTFGRGPLKGLSLGGGASYAGTTRPGAQFRQRFELTEAATLFSALASYEFKVMGHAFTAVLNGKNLADKHYIDRQQSISMGRRITLTFRTEF